MAAALFKLKRFGHWWDDISDFIIRPRRFNTYTESDLGPSIFIVNGETSKRFIRVDFPLTNMRDMTIQCSWYRPEEYPAGGMPCVVYLHGNCGARVDALEILFLLTHNISVFAFDACGSGKSDGEYVSLGFYERQDLATVIEFLNGTKIVSAIGLWGRSMGAVTSIMYASKDPVVCCIIADSPFSTLRSLVRDLVADNAHWIPGVAIDASIATIRNNIIHRAAFDIDDLDTVKYAKECNVPVFLFHGESDDFVKPHHSYTLRESFPGLCRHRLVRGGHNSRRDEVQKDTASFLKQYLLADAAALAQHVPTRRFLSKLDSPQEVLPPCEPLDCRERNDSTQATASTGSEREEGRCSGMEERHETEGAAPT